MAMCQGKTKFASATRAQEVAAAPLKSGKKNPQLYVYQCRVCHCYHLSRSPTQIAGLR